MRTQLDARMRSSSTSGTRTAPILLLSASTNTGRDASKFRSASQTRLSNIFCAGCGSPGRSPSTEPRCRARASRSRTCAPRAASDLQQAAFAAAGGAADDAIVESRRQFVELREHGAPIALIAALQRRRVPADFAQDERHGARPLAAAPAVDQRFPALVARAKCVRDGVPRFSPPALRRSCALRTATPACRPCRPGRALRC